jgi:hypothetical protein
MKNYTVKGNRVDIERTRDLNNPFLIHDLSMEVKYNVYQKGVYTGDLIKVTSDSIEFQPLLPAEFITMELVLKEDNMERPVKPPLGIIPKNIWKKQRLGELRDAVERYLEANQRVPIEWIEEYNELLEDIRKGVDDNGN